MFRISQIVGRDAILTTFGCGRYTAVKHTIVERLYRIGSIACLQVGESASICHNILQGFDVSIVYGGIVDITKHAVCKGEPDI